LTVSSPKAATLSPGLRIMVHLSGAVADLNPAAVSNFFLLFDPLVRFDLVGKTRSCRD
jgi:hypothetical protein